MQEVPVGTSREDAQLPVGSFLRERYVVEDMLGKGGFGAVYLVRDLRVRQNLFALKEVIDPDKKERQRFLFEGELLRRLEHRSLPKVYRLFEEDTQHRAYMLMDYIEGPNLETLRQQQSEKRFSLPQVLTIIAPIMEALSYLHNQEPPIIHRDIKPSNIIVPTTGDEAVLVDFGIAKEYDPGSTTTAVRRCTPGYAAPEQYATGTNICTDIYGLGATLYALLTGIVPADAFYRMTQLNSQGIDPLVPINKLVPSVPKPISDAISQAMSINNANRFSAVEHFWQSLNPLSSWKQASVPFISRSIPVLASPSILSSISTPSSIPASQLNPQQASTPISPSTPVPPAVAPDKQAASRIPVPATVVLHRRAPEHHSRKPFMLLGFLALLLTLAIATILLAYTGSHPTTASSPKRPASLQTVTAPASSVRPTVAPTVHGRGTPIAVSPKPSSTAVMMIPTAPPVIVPTTVPPVQPTQVPTSYPTSLPTARPTPTPRPTPAPTPTPVPAVYPNVAGNYNGTIDNTTANITTTMALTIQQKGNGSISGNFVVGPALVGSGPFTGKVATNKYVEFTVASYHGNAPLFFYGWVQSDGSLKGEYCSLNSQNQCDPSVGAGGTWDVLQAGAGSSTVLMVPDFIIYLIVRLASVW